MDEEGKKPKEDTEAS